MTPRSLMLGAVAGLLCLHAGTAAIAQTPLAPTPPMAWNSWDSYALTITEAQFRANVEVQAARLKSFGWNYAVIDEGWYLKDPSPDKSNLQFQIDANGRYIPVPARFPSAANEAGFIALGQYVHSLGLSFGIHIIRGIPRVSTSRNLPIAESAFKTADAADTADACPWDPTNWGVKDNAAGQAWYDALFRQYAGWGVDLVKVDCISDHPYKPTEIRQIDRAIAKSGRAMVLSLSPGPTALEHAQEVGGLAQMWRISDDIWDFWKTSRAYPGGIFDQFARAAAWAPFARPGNWPDADMLPIGKLSPLPDVDKARSSRLTHDEQRTLLTLWSMARSPLILGANLTELDDWTTGLITNRDVIAIDQHGHDQKQISREGNLIVWTSQGDAGSHYLALFNIGDTALDLKQPLAKYQFGHDRFAAKDLWEQKDLGTISEVSASVAPHGCLLLQLRPAR